MCIKNDSQYRTSRFLNFLKVSKRKSQKDPQVLHFFKKSFGSVAIRKSPSWFTSIPRREFVSWQKDCIEGTHLSRDYKLSICASTPIWKAFCCMVFTSSKKRFVIWWMKTPKCNVTKNFIIAVVAKTLWQNEKSWQITYNWSCILFLQQVFFPLAVSLF